MSTLAIDYGEKHLGLAFSPDEKVSHPLSTIHIKDLREKIKGIKKVCKEYDISQIVIGLPLDQEGKLSPPAEKARGFGEKLRKSLGLKVFYQDETLTSAEALEKMLAAGVPKEKRKELEHSFAAQVILQEYLDVDQV